MPGPCRRRERRALLDRVRSVPGVRAAGTVQALPLSGNTSVRPYQIEGGPGGNDRPVAHYRIITPGYLEAMRIRLIAGRTFTDRDTADRALAVIVNQALARQAWGDRNPVGQRITFGGSIDRWAEVVGVVGDVRHFGPGVPPAAEMYWPSAQIDAVPGPTLRSKRRQSTLVVASDSVDIGTLVSSARAAVREIDPDQPIANVRSMASLMDASLWLSRASAWLLAMFGAAALLFALVGISGATAYAVTQRRRELAVRLALGAAPERLARVVLAGACASALAGVILGIALALAIRRSASALLVDTDPIDPATLAAAAAFLIATTVIACWPAARRAARIDPMQALRVD